LFIVCFRHRPPGLPPGPELDRRQAEVRQRLIEQGSFYLVQTRLPTGLHLRTTLLNPFTTMDHLMDLLQAFLSV
jgi:L-2,4-diaminobutyrate decarboxylase